MRCEHWFKFDGVCKHCGYQKPIPDLCLVPLRTKAPQANRAGVVKPIIPVMRTALEQIQELHKPQLVEDFFNEIEGSSAHRWMRVCSVCDTSDYPCKTRKLADAGLGVPNE